MKPDKKRVAAVLAAMDQQYGRDKLSDMKEREPWHILISTILAAQCTDKRVAIVTVPLFKRYPTIAAMAEADQAELEEYIRPVGVYRNKAKNIIACCRRLSEVYGGEVPSSVEDLTSLAGVGRKTANVIRGNVFHEPSIVVDTHVKRISQKLGFTKEQDPVKIEYDLMELLPEEHWIRYNLQLIVFGREICLARRPKCGACFIKDYCPSCESELFKKPEDIGEIRN